MIEARERAVGGAPGVRAAARDAERAPARPGTAARGLLLAAALVGLLSPITAAAENEVSFRADVDATRVGLGAHGPQLGRSANVMAVALFASGFRA